MENFEVECPYCGEEVSISDAAARGEVTCSYCESSFSCTIMVEVKKHERRKLSNGMHYADDEPSDSRDITLVNKYGSIAIGYFADGSYKARNSVTWSNGLADSFAVDDFVIGWYEPKGIADKDLVAMRKAAEA